MRLCAVQHEGVFIQGEHLKYLNRKESIMKEIFAWATFDGEGSYELRLYEDNENYLEEWVNRNGEYYRNWVVPLYREINE